MGPYRTPARDPTQLPPLPPRPACQCQLGPDTLAALAACGGPIGTPACLDWQALAAQHQQAAGARRSRWWDRLIPG